MAASGFNPPSSGSFPKALEQAARLLRGDMFQSSFIWIIPESTTSTPDDNRHPDVSILLHLDHSRKPPGEPTLRARTTGFNPPSSGSFPKARNTASYSRRYMPVSILLHLDHSRKPDWITSMSCRQYRFQSSFIWIIPESGLVFARGPDSGIVSILLHLDHSRKRRRANRSMRCSSRFNPPSSGSFPKAASPPKALTSPSAFQSSFIWIIPESAGDDHFDALFCAFQSSFIWIIPESPRQSAVLTTAY